MQNGLTLRSASATRSLGRGSVVRRESWITVILSFMRLTFRYERMRSSDSMLAIRDVYL